MKRFTLAAIFILLATIKGFGGEPKVIKAISPIYPAVARAAQVAGVVDVEVTLNPDGTVKDVLPMPENVYWKVLFSPSSKAAAQWVFEPGSTSPVRITFVYHLYPTGTPDTMLSSEVISPRTMVVRAKVIYLEQRTLHEN